MFGGAAQYSISSGALIVTVMLITFRLELREAVRDLASQLLNYITFYVICLLSTSLIVWPAAGPWSTDWVSNYMQMEVVWKGEPLKEWLLARPLLFPSIAVPYLGLMEPLFAFQLSISAANASALLCVLSFVQSFVPAKLKMLPFVILFCASPFFLVNFISFVPKFLQATLIVGAFLMMRGARDQHMASRMALSSLLLGFAMECHHSTIAYLPAIAIGWLWVGWQCRWQLLLGVVLAGLVAVLVVCPPELRKVSMYGLEEIAKYNPSKAMRSPEPGWFVFLMTLECKFLGYQFLVPPYIWLKETWLGTAKPAEHYIYWFWFAWMSLEANTFAFMLAPFIFTWHRSKTYLQYLLGHVPSVLFAGAAIAIVVNCLLNPYYIMGGNVHCGSTALALTLMIMAIALVAQRSDYLMVSASATLVVGCIPFVAWQCIQFSKVLAKGGFKSSGVVLDDNLDQPALLSISQTPWGYAQWPLLPLVLGLILLFLLAHGRKSQTGEQTRTTAYAWSIRDLCG
jgi:hypothetical protein